MSKKEKDIKRILENRALKLHQRDLRSKEKLKTKRKNLQGLNSEEKGLAYLYNKRYKNYVKIKAPTELSIVHNPEETITFINRIKEQYDKEKQVFIILRKTSELGYDALVLLLSILIRFKAKNIDFNGDYPENPGVKKNLENSGFFSYLYKKIGDQERYDFIKGGISTHAWKKVDAGLTHKIITESSKKIWKNIRRCQGVQRSLIELMHNTNNHAVFNKQGEKHWFLSVQYVKKENKVCFSFIDFGVGIFESLNNKGKESKWYDWQKPLSKLFTFNNNKELLKLILNGELHRTVTRKPYRGKGLPGIYDSYKRNNFSKFHIISNDVYANVAENDFRTLKNSFSGTFVYWEINDKNINIDGIN